MAKALHNTWQEIIVGHQTRKTRGPCLSQGFNSGLYIQMAAERLMEQVEWKPARQKKKEGQRNTNTQNALGVPSLLGPWFYIGKFQIGRTLRKESSHQQRRIKSKEIHCKCQIGVWNPALFRFSKSSELNHIGTER
jgi:hypothetical protein